VNGDELVRVLALILPLYLANGAAPLASKLPRRTPLDLGLNWFDGRRIFGDGKTFEGLGLGLLGGFIGGVLSSPVINQYRDPLFTLLVAFSALMGDLIGAFIKRRIGLPRGSPLAPLDQLDFLLMGLAAAASRICISAMDLLLAIAITLIMHVSTNYAAYVLRVKQEPW